MKVSKRQYYQTQKKFSKTLIIIPILILCFCILIFFQWNRIQLAIKGYNFAEQGMILSLDDKIIQDYLTNEKIENLESWNQYNNDKHYQEYSIYQQYHPAMKQQEIIQYIDTFYSNYYEKLIALHYPFENLLKYMQTASLNDFDYLIQQKLDYQQTEAYLSIQGCIYTDLKKYIESSKEPLEAVLSISYPFIDSHYKATQNYLIVDPNSYATLIKKGFQIASDYVPKDLVTPNIPFSPDCDNKQLRKAASDALEQMYQAALKKDLHLAINSAYRTYQQQKAIYDEYHQKYDEVTANGLVAIPGSSEHQLGLGVDLTSQSVIDGKWRFFGDTPEYQWVVKNAYQYGFILRYPSSQSALTGTANEPWHFRYVGKDIAKIIYENNWTLEDYTMHYGFTGQLEKIKKD
ncbi:M15 family metallopeptidase [Candidatus Stoquefichus massiliensis]|uniref:M15 family metallopeptidase n=1 Tax=Candidatus Stoquefichus massiliensis TaxID=1470350 RepID=UPI00047F1D9E|nr:M15 family metallopeptidase [Candidatus Stoquefichus massiliensis]